MKGQHPVITLLGSNSGNNLGDAAILSSVLATLSDELPGAEFLVPTTKPSFIRTHYARKFNVKALNMMPWTGSIRFLGIPTLWALARSDCALICDGIIFGKRLLNPTFNFLITLIFLVPWCKLTRCKLVCYSTGIGPFPTALSRALAAYLLRGCALLMMRENDSRKLVKELGVTTAVQLTGDAAFINSVSPDTRAEEMARQEGIDLSIPMIGVNVTAYMDEWLSKGEQMGHRQSFLERLAQGITEARNLFGFQTQVVVFSTHPMDEPAVKKLATLAGAKVLLNREYLSHDIQAFMRRCALFIGMRFHSLILASAVKTPIVALVYAPKVRGFMRLLDCEDVAIELSASSSDKIRDTVLMAWVQQKELRNRQQLVIEELKAKARKAATLLRECVFPELTFGSRKSSAKLPAEKGQVPSSAA